MSNVDAVVLLKYPFYPLFNFDNGMNLISESLTILTSAQLLVVFASPRFAQRSIRETTPRSREDRGTPLGEPRVVLVV